MKATEIIKIVDRYSESLEKWTLKSFTPLSLITRCLIEECNLSKLEAERLAMTAVNLLRSKINNKIEEYDELGVHPPIFWLNDDDLVGTYKNKQCELNFDWYESKLLRDYIRRACPNKMLLISVLSVLCEGFEFAEIVDGGNDGGIDIIAKKTGGGSIYGRRVLFIQSKKCSKTLDKKVLIYEDAFFKDNMIKSVEIRNMYLDKLGVKINTPTIDIKYTFITNGDLTDTIKDYSIRNNVLLLNSFILSHTIMGVLNMKQAISIIDNWFQEKKYLRGEKFIPEKNCQQ